MLLHLPEKENVVFFPEHVCFISSPPYKVKKLCSALFILIVRCLDVLICIKRNFEDDCVKRNVEKNFLMLGKETVYRK